MTQTQTGTQNGTITLWHADRAFGFITTVTGQQYFFHINNFAKGEFPVVEGQVEFEVAPGLSTGKRPQAVHVRYRKSGAPSTAALETTEAAIHGFVSGGVAQ